MFRKIQVEENLQSLKSLWKHIIPYCMIHFLRVSQFLCSIINKNVFNKSLYFSLCCCWASRELLVLYILFFLESSTSIFFLISRFLLRLTELKIWLTFNGELNIVACYNFLGCKTFKVCYRHDPYHLSIKMLSKKEIKMLFVSSSGYSQIAVKTMKRNMVCKNPQTTSFWCLSSKMQMEEIRWSTTVTISFRPWRGKLDKSTSPGDVQK